MLPPAKRGISVADSVNFGEHCAGHGFVFGSALDETLTTYADLERSQSYLGSVNVSCDTPDYRTWTDAQRFSAFITHAHAKGVLSCHAYERVVGFCAITRTRTRSTMPTV